MDDNGFGELEADAAKRLRRVYILWITVMAALPIPIVLPRAEPHFVNAWHTALGRAWDLVADQPVENGAKALAQTGIAHWLVAHEQLSGFLHHRDELWRITAILTNIHYAGMAALNLGEAFGIDFDEEDDDS
ncbi:hypothetical protein [Embleya sp. NPDC059237]|uniref:hypothetical protein n=1 Tax=Embleya sp. NPDC059237 TaxID=3346784 RepID=UPI0036745A1D